MNNLSLLILILVSVSIILIQTSVMCLDIHRIKKYISDINSQLFALNKRCERNREDIYDIKKALLTINGNIGTLSSSTDQITEEIASLDNSTRKALNDLKALSNNPVMPTPNITKMMRETILDNINIEMLLSSGMKIPNKQSTQHIIENTVATYPDVDREFTVKLCLAMIENFALNVQEGRKSELK